MNTAEESIKILLVDDEKDFRTASSKALERRGFIVTTAANGEEALNYIHLEMPDIVLLDLLMPGMSGIETLQRIRKINSSLPVIILTGHGSFHDALAGINLDIVDFLQKPMDLDLLDLRIRKALEPESGKLLKERTISELMASPSIYPKIYLDQPIMEVVEKLKEAFFPRSEDVVKPSQIRSALVYNRDESFMGIIRFPDLLKLVLPSFLSESPYSSYFTGMFLAQCKMIGNRNIYELIGERVLIDINAPLMEAVHLMLDNHIINIAVMRGGEIAGILREKDVIYEIMCNISSVNNGQ
ncbi:response regulator [bacterium]|nr:response regulator [bacterium]